MRDRLLNLQTSDPPGEEFGDEENHPEEQLEPFIVFDGQETMDGLHKEVQALRRDMQLLRMDVRHLREQNSRFLTSVRRFSSIKRDANALRQDIKDSMNGIYARMERLKTQGRALEEQPDSSAAVARMVQLQCASLATTFRQIVYEYNEAEMSQREHCLSRIQRQANIVGKELSKEQIEEMIETGKVNLFSDNILLEGRSARSALNELENRHKELLALESRIREIQELFSQMAQLVEEQGYKLDNIEANMLATQDYVAKAHAQLRKAVRYKKSNPCKKLFCSCFPCCH